MLFNVQPTDSVVITPIITTTAATATISSPVSFV